MKHIKFLALLLIMFMSLIALAQSTSEKKVILQQIVRDDKDAKEFVDDAGGITSSLESVSITKVDLNKDGQSELVVDLMLGCGAVDNCPFYVYRKSGNNYNLLLSGSGNAYKILKTKTDGYNDIRSQAHSSASETYVVIYKFESGRYKAKNCLTQKVVGKRVKIIPEKCEQ
jgi:hypothetical protein